MRLDSLAALLDSYSYERVLARGFALVRDAADNPMTSAAAVAPGIGLRIQFGDGEVAATATGVAEPPPSRRREPARRDKRDDKQGKLL
jgi:exodeoxyribonuclease VII large subunit